MTRKPGDTGRPPPSTRTRKTGPVVIPDVLPKPLQRYAAAGGASLLGVPPAEVTAEHLRKVVEVIGPLTPGLLLTLYRNTGNPLWLWYSLAGLKTPGQIPPKTFTYLVDAANKIVAGIAGQAASLENVQITPGKELEEGITNRSRSDLTPPDILEILALARPGVNLFRSAAGNLRDIGYAVALANLVRETGASVDDACATIARAVGRVSAEAGPAVASIKHMVASGKELLRDRDKTRR